MRLDRRDFLWAAAGLLLLPLASRLPAQDANKRGVHLLLDDGRNQWETALWATHLDYARAGVGEWGYVTQLIRSDDLDAGRWQLFMDLCAERRLIPIIRLATTFDRNNRYWNAPPRDADGSYRTIAGQFAAFLAALNWHYAPHHITVGNEPNHGNEWSGRADPEAYARFFIDVADALHTADAAARVMNAGFDPYTPHTNGQPFIDGMAYMDAETFLDEMIAAYPDVFERLDGWVSHPYPPNQFTAGPWEQLYAVDYLNGAANPRHVSPPPGIFNRGVNGYEWELWKLASYGITGLPVYITETGWRHAESTDPNAQDRIEGLPAAATAAAYLDMALRGNDGRYPQYPATGWTPWLADSRVVAVTPFALNGVPHEWGHTNWLLLDSAGTVLGTYPLYEALAQLPG